MVQDKINYTSWNNTGRLSRDNDTTSAADRHEMEQQSGFNKKITRILETIENDFPNTQLELQQLIA
ncbi:TPA: hypothetical protein DEP21_01355 [Patescibacteria group bacterium]|nr:hypothetical protein [Candidatus Gracilibacteria bacterium]